MNTSELNSSEKVNTYCRICEALCGLEANFEDGEFVGLKPDKEHPVSKGYACIKGVSFANVHDSDNRVNYPLKRTASGFERISWKQAISEISEKTKSLKKKHGKRSIAQYMGNPSFFDAASTLLIPDFAKTIGSPNVYCSHSVDLNNKFYAGGLFYGLEELLPIPDLNHCDFFMCLGGNPVVSQMSVIGAPNAILKLKAIEERGGKVVIVDPRKTETANKVGEHLALTPRTDVFLLLGLLNALLQCEDIIAPQREAIERHADRFEQLNLVAKQWPIERVSKVIGIEEQNLKTLFDKYLKASTKNGAVVYMSTGVNMSGYGSVCYWLVQAINFVSGNFDRKGGSFVPQGSFDFISLLLKLHKQRESEEKTLVDGWKKVSGFFPVGALPDEILADSPERIRSLFISAGNPCHSVPHPKWHEAMSQLDLVVVLDLFVNDTAKKYADYILPSTDMLERESWGLSQNMLQLDPFVHYTDSVFEVKYERRDDWEIYSEIASACGVEDRGTALGLITTINSVVSKIPFLKWRVGPSQLSKTLTRKTLANWNALRDSKRGIKLPEHVYGKFFDRWPSSMRLNLAPQPLIDDLVRVEKLEVELLKNQEGDQFSLIGMRDRRTHNSWMRNNESIKTPEENSVLMNPDDASRLGVEKNATVIIATDRAQARFPAKLTKDVAKGVVAVPHGWGDIDGAEDADTVNQKKQKGENINRLMAPELEPGSGQAILTGQRVRVRLGA